MKKVAIYIDGLNLYHGICDAGWKHWLWLDLGKLAIQLAPKGASVTAVNYFTAPAREDGSRERQGAFLEANREMCPNLRITLGKLVPGDCCTCPKCHETMRRWHEKRTDVNIAIGMVIDTLAHDREFDTIFLVTGDSDQIPAIKLVQAKGVDVQVRLPPQRPSGDLTQTVGGTGRCYEITQNQLRKSQMQEQVACTRNNNFVVRRPDWGDRPQGWERA